MKKVQNWHVLQNEDPLFKHYFTIIENYETSRDELSCVLYQRHVSCIIPYFHAIANKL